MGKMIIATLLIGGFIALAIDQGERLLYWWRWLTPGLKRGWFIAAIAVLSMAICLLFYEKAWRVFHLGIVLFGL